MEIKITIKWDELRIDPLFTYEVPPLLVADKDVADEEEE